MEGNDSDSDSSSTSSSSMSLLTFMGFLSDGTDEFFDELDESDFFVMMEMESEDEQDTHFDDVLKELLDTPEKFVRIKKYIETVRAMPDEQFRQTFRIRRHNAQVLIGIDSI